MNYTYDFCGVSDLEDNCAKNQTNATIGWNMGCVLRGYKFGGFGVKLDAYFTVVANSIS